MNADQLNWPEEIQQVCRLQTSCGAYPVVGGVWLIPIFGTIITDQI